MSDGPFGFLVGSSIRPNFLWIVDESRSTKTSRIQLKEISCFYGDYQSKIEIHMRRGC